LQPTRSPPPIRRPLAIAALLAIPHLVVAIAPAAGHAKRPTALNNASQVPRAVAV
jgi:hypothetical protein